MKTRPKPTIPLIAAALLMAAASALSQTYTIQTIAPPAGTASCFAYELNSSGAVVGYSSVKVGKSTVPGPAFIWQSGNSVILPPLAGQADAESSGISDAGLAVGGPSWWTPVQNGRATWWEANGSGYTPHDWNEFVPAGWNLTLLRASGISDDGRYVIFGADLAAGGLRDIIAEVQLDPTGQAPEALVQFWDVDNIYRVTSMHHDGLGQVRATYMVDPGNAQTQAFLWQKGSLGDVQVLSLHPAMESETIAWGINAPGVAVGKRRNSGVDRAVVWLPTGSGYAMHDIGTLGGSESTAFSINVDGYAVGWASLKRNGQHAFLWHAGSGMRDLNALRSPSDTSGVELTSARAINNVGQILAWGSTKKWSGPVLLTPTP